MRIGVYTGSFDPLHRGHIKIIKTILSKKIVDKVLIVPSNDYWGKRLCLLQKDRVRIINMSLKKEKIKYEIDSKLGDYQYTYEVFRELKEKHPKNKYCLILGADNIEKFDKWKNYEELIENPFIVISRNVDDVEEKIHRLDVKEYIFLDIKGINHISSTYIRNNLDSYSKVENMIGKEEFEFIKKRIRTVRAN